MDVVVYGLGCPKVGADGMESWVMDQEVFWNGILGYGPRSVLTCLLWGSPWAMWVLDCVQSMPVGFEACVSCSHTCDVCV